jgi:pyrroloquinoline quinone (PQQ) biosynthesis protein C
VDKTKKLLAYYDLFPFERHPLWSAVFAGTLSREQVLKAEGQHYLRTKAGQQLRRRAATQSKRMNASISAAMLETYLEECTNKRGTNHLDLVQRLLTSGGVTQAEIDATVSTPGNTAAIALYGDIGSRGAACHLLGAGAVEHFYSRLSPKIFESYTVKYGMTADAAETYKLHGTMDAVHADRAFGVLDEALKLHDWSELELAVRDAFVATSLHYDGMLQAATGKITYWEGSTR